ncbi:MAG: hypothetical protein HY303_13320, partial [Candidatus Wallbacteria bacterium]|nr:hypothetical protein [Candidatus Wallbacteria bacterium]
MPQKKWYRSRRLWRVVFALLLAAGGLAGLVAWRFRQIASTGELAKILCERLAVELGMPVTVKSAEVHGLTQVDAKELRMLAPEGEMPIEAAQLSITFDGWSLLQGTLEPLTFELETLELDVTTPKKLVELKKTLERIQRQPHHFHPTILVTLARVATEQGRFTGDRLSLERPKYGNRGFRAQGVFEPAAADPVALQLRGVYTALPDSISGSLSLKSPWLEAYADGGITGATTHPQLKTAVRLDRLDLAVAAQKLGGQGRAIQGGVLSGRVTLTGEPGAPVVEGDLAPQDLALELPEVGLATVRSGRFDLGPGQALCREMVVETKFGVFGVEGALRAPASDPTLSLRASCASFDLTPLLEKRRLPATIEGGCSAVIGVEGHATRPVVRAELGVRGLDIEWPNEKVGPIPIRVLLATVLYSADALKASGADVTVWGVPATGDISIDDLSGGMKISAEVRAPDVDLGRLAKRLPPVVKRALELYRVQGRTAVTAQVSGVRGDYSVVLEGGAAGLELAVPLAQQWLPVKLSSGRVTLSRQTLFGSRLEGMVSGTPFTGEVAIANLLDAPSVTGEAVLRKAR